MENDIIAQIETDKVTIDVKYTSKAPGVLSALLVAAGDVVQVGHYKISGRVTMVCQIWSDCVPHFELQLKVVVCKQVDGNKCIASEGRIC